MKLQFARRLLPIICILGAAIDLSRKAAGLAWWYQQDSWCPAAAQQQDKILPHASISSSVTARLAAHIALFTKQYEEDIASPQTTTARGDYRHNALLDDYSLRASKRQNDANRTNRVKLRALSTEGFSEQDQRIWFRSFSR